MISRERGESVCGTLSNSTSAYKMKHNSHRISLSRPFWTKNPNQQFGRWNSILVFLRISNFIRNKQKYNESFPRSVGGITSKNSKREHESKLDHPRHKNMFVTSFRSHPNDSCVLSYPHRYLSSSFRSTNSSIEFAAVQYKFSLIN